MRASAMLDLRVSGTLHCMFHSVVVGGWLVDRYQAKLHLLGFVVDLLYNKSVSNQKSKTNPQRVKMMSRLRYPTNIQEVEIVDFGLTAGAYRTLKVAKG